MEFISIGSNSLYIELLNLWYAEHSVSLNLTYKLFQSLKCAGRQQEEIELDQMKELAAKQHLLLFGNIKQEQPAERRERNIIFIDIMVYLTQFSQQQLLLGWTSKEFNLQ